MILLALLVSVVANAQSDIWVSGYVYTEVEGQQVMIPFATISVYDLTETDKMEYYSVSGMQGNYTIKPYHYQKPYHYVVRALGFKTKEFNLKAIPEYIDGKPFSGNASVNVKLERDSAIQVPHTQCVAYTMSELQKKGKAKSIIDAFNLLDEIKQDGNDWIDMKSEESVCFFMNGMYVTADVYAKLQYIPADMIAKLEYYKLPKNCDYGAAVNIMLSVGSESKAPNYKLGESELVY